MKRWMFKIILFLLLGAIINIAVAWGIVIVHGDVAFEWRPYHNPRNEDPIAFFVNERFGEEWVVGCGRPGTLMGRHGDKVKHYSGKPWWPREAVTFDNGPYAIAAGWPSLGLSAWRTIKNVADDDQIQFVSSYHWGWRLSTGSESAWDILPATVPLRPIWPGFAINTIFYSAALWLLFVAPFTLRRLQRKSRDLCLNCAYPVGASDTCTECGRPAGGVVRRGRTTVPWCALESFRGSRRGGEYHGTRAETDFRLLTSDL